MEVAPSAWFDLLPNGRLLHYRHPDHPRARAAIGPEGPGGIGHGGQRRDGIGRRRCAIERGPVSLLDGQRLGLERHHAIEDIGASLCGAPFALLASKNASCRLAFLAAAKEARAALFGLSLSEDVLPVGLNGKTKK